MQTQNTSTNRGRAADHADEKLPRERQRQRDIWRAGGTVDVHALFFLQWFRLDTLSSHDGTRLHRKNDGVISYKVGDLDHPFRDVRVEEDGRVNDAGCSYCGNEDGSCDRPAV